MQVRVVDVLVAHRFMAMPVRMWLRYRLVMFVLVMLVVKVAVLMLHYLVLMYVLVSLGQVQIEAHGHQRSGAQQLCREGFPQQGKRD